MSCRPQSELLSSYVLGLLSEAETDNLLTHLEICPDCRSQSRELEATAAELARAAPPVEVPSGLRERVLSVANPPQVWKAWAQTELRSDLHVVRADEGEWSEVRAGVFAKQLYVDRTRDLATMLVRMEPGSRYVPHRHAAPEQCFVLQGDVREGNHVFRAGDFQCLASGSKHDAQWTQDGCLLLIVSSLHDELL